MGSEIRQESQDEPQHVSRVVTPESLAELQDFIRIFLRGEIDKAQREGISSTEQSLGSILNYEDIDPEKVMIVQGTADRSDSVSLLAQRNKINADGPSRAKQFVALHPNIQLHRSTFESVLNETAQRLLENPRNAIELLISTYYQEGIPHGLRILPSTEDNEKIPAALNRFKVIEEAFLVHHPQCIGGRSEKTRTTLERLHKRVEQLLRNDENSAIALKYEQESPMKVRIFKLKVDVMKTFHQQLWSGFTVPPNVTQAMPKASDFKKYTKADSFGLCMNPQTLEFYEGDIHALRATLLEYSEMGDVYVDITPKSQKHEIIIKVFVRDYIDNAWSSEQE